MTDEAARARAAAMSVECKKDGLSQLQSGNWKLTLTISPVDMPQAILSAPMGTRYMAALVEVDDTEQPVARSESPEKIKSEGEKAKAHFEATCQDSSFVDWLWLERPAGCSAHVVNPGDTRELAKNICGVQSANEFMEHPEKWTGLFEEFKYRDSRR